MIIPGNKVGQLGNRLFKFSHLLATAKENNLKLIYPFFDEYKHLYPKIIKEKGVSIVFHKNKIINKFLLFVFGLFNKFSKYVFKRSPWHENIISRDTEVNLSDPRFKNRLHKKIVIINGWHTRDRYSFHRHSGEIKRIFSPAGVHKLSIDRFISNLRNGYDFLVGVHIRRGDYKEYVGGKYFYPFEFYSTKCKELLRELNGVYKNIVFVVCSNETIDLKAFKEINVACSTGNIIEDLYILSKCDLIFGPPSTFSMWASFYGDVPLLHLYNQNQEMTLSQFKVHQEYYPG